MWFWYSTSTMATIRWLMLSSLLIGAGPSAASPKQDGAKPAPKSVDSLLCLREFVDGPAPKQMYVSVEHTASAVATVSAQDDLVTVCQDAAKKRCNSFVVKAAANAQIRADGAEVLVSSANVLGLHNAATGKRTRTFRNKPRKGDSRSSADSDMTYNCGSGEWLGDVILAWGWDCGEYDARPYLASAKTGAFIAPLVNTKFSPNEDAIYEVAHLQGANWAIGVFAPEDGSGQGLTLGKVFVVDVKTGKTSATITGIADGGAIVDERKAKRTLDKIPACATH